MDDILSVLWREVQNEWRRDPEAQCYAAAVQVGVQKPSKRTHRRLLKMARRRVAQRWGCRLGFEVRERRGALEIYPARRCGHCNELFSKPNLHAKYCSPEHADKAKLAQRQKRYRRQHPGGWRYWLPPRSPYKPKNWRLLREWNAGRLHPRRDSVATLTLGEDEFVGAVLAGYQLPEPNAGPAPPEVVEELATEF